MEKNNVHTSPPEPSTIIFVISKFPSSIPPKNHDDEKYIITIILNKDNIDIVVVPFIAEKKSCNNTV